MERRKDEAPTDDLAQVIRRAGRRPAPAPEIQAAVRAAVEREWTGQVSRRARRTTILLRIAAALAAVAVGVSWHALRPGATADPVAVGTFVAARGSVHIAPVAGRDWVVAGSRLDAGSSIETGPSGYVLLTVARVAMRVGPGSLIDLERAGHVRLVRGRIYADSGSPSAPARALVIDTAFGLVTHLGTQFQVRVGPAAMSVSVRDGKVLVSRADGRAFTIARGQGLRVSSDGGVNRLDVTPYGTDWAWVSEFSPSFPIDGRPLSAFLSWYARETGLTLVLPDPGIRAELDRTILSGNVIGLSPAQALAAVMATTRFEYDMNTPGELRIEIRATGGAT